jgi:hypothetical protein
VCAALPFLAAADATVTPRSSSVAQPRIDPARVAQLRASLAAQVAVYDSAEQAMRAPTASESAALALPAPAMPAQTFRLSRGGRALKADVTQLSFSQAAVRPDGTLGVMLDGQGGVNDR